MKIAVVILAGGAGSRIGGDKPSKLLGGKPLIERAEALARKWSEILAVSVRSPAQAASTRLPCIFDEEGIEGPLAGLATALRFAGCADCESVLTIPADMPFLPADLGERLVAEIGRHKVAIASSGGRLHPVCGLWRLSALDSVSAYVASGRRSLRGFAEAVGFSPVEWACLSNDPFFNINSATDLATAERILES